MFYYTQKIEHFFFNIRQWILKIHTTITEHNYIRKN